MSRYTDNDEFRELRAWELGIYLDAVDEHGYMIIGFVPGAVPTPLFHTVGLSTQDEYGYELAISGLPNELGPPLLNLLVGVIKERGIVPTEGLPVELDCLKPGTALRLHAADPEGPFEKISQYTGLPSPVWQAVWPDIAGRYPGDPDCSLTLVDQADLALPGDSSPSP